jgi:hypothetical protein
MSPESGEVVIIFPSALVFRALLFKWFVLWPFGLALRPSLKKRQIEK